MNQQEEKNLYLLGWILLGVFLSYFFIGNFSNPDAKNLFHLPCIFRTLTGYYCPGCGGTRACIALLHGHLLRSLLCHPVVPYCAAIYVLFMLSHTIEILSNGKLAIGLRYRDGYIKIAAVIIIVQWILRNFLKWKWGIDVLAT